MAQMEFAVQYLKDNGCSCVAYDGIAILESKKRGVAPLLQWLEEEKNLSYFSVADKVVGKGAAFLYLLLHAKRLHAFVISEPALDVLQQQGVTVTYEKCVPAISNRDSTGFCPIESAVLDCEDPNQALGRIVQMLDSLRS